MFVLGSKSNRPISDAKDDVLRLCQSMKPSTGEASYAQKWKLPLTVGSVEKGAKCGIW